MPSSVCIKFILYHQKWRKLPLRIWPETFFSRQHKLSPLVDIALHFPQKHQSRFPLHPLVLFQLFCFYSWRTDFSACILIVTYCSFKVVKLWSDRSSHRCSVTKVFFGISQNSQENTCARVSFLKESCRPEARNFI